MPADRIDVPVRRVAVSPVPEHIRLKVKWRILPYLFLLYIIAFIDRANVSYAALGMVNETWINAEVLGFGAGIFFIGYVLLEIPSTIVVERWSARKWMARIMISWGIIASSMGFVHSAQSFYVLRFLLGVGEAGFFPGIIVYLSHWFVDRDRARAVAFFYAAVPLAFIVGAPISRSLLQIHWYGLDGWRWLFILEGIPAVIFGVLNIWLLTDWPRDAKWLAPADRLTLQAAIDAERQQKPSHLTPFAFMKHPVVLLLSLIYFLAVCGSYGFGLWLPTMLKGLSGLTNSQVLLLSALPYVVSLICVLTFSWTSDRMGERIWHVAVPLFVMATGLTIGSFFQTTNLWIIMLGFCVVGSGVYTYIPTFWTHPARALSGTAAAASVGIINSIGNLGGFVGPYLMGWLQRHTQSFAIGMGVLLFLQIAAGSLVFLLRKYEPARGATGRH